MSEENETEEELTPEETADALQLSRKRVGELSEDLEVALETAKVKSEAAQKRHDEEVAGLNARLIEMNKGQNTRVSKAVKQSQEDWTVAISDVVAKLPASWAPSIVAKKIVDPDFVHPNGIADFQAKIDDNGNVVRYNGELVPNPY